MEGCEEISSSNSHPERGLGFPGGASLSVNPELPAEEIKFPVRDEFEDFFSVTEVAKKDHGSEDCHDQNLSVNEDVQNLCIKEAEKDSENEENSQNNLAVVEDDGNDSENEQNGVVVKDDEKDHDSEENGKDNESDVQDKDCEDEVVSKNVGDEPPVTKDVNEEEEVWERRTLQYPLRPDAEDCSFYIRTGVCKFGLNCKFNHPVRRKNQAVKEKMREIKEFPDSPWQAECKYYLKTAGCKFGKACKYNHTRGKSSVAAAVEFNFLGLPIRLGERECPYYIRTGCCKYGSNCRFNHPDPTARVGCDRASGGSISLGGASESTVAPWPSPETLNETSPLVPRMSTASSNYEWNGYQVSVHSAERSVHPSRAFITNSSTVGKCVYLPHQQMQVGEFPERPGQPECCYFLKTGNCKYRSACRYHHPKNRLPKSPQCTVSDQGLPLRPDQNTCSFYDRYGICKFGPACKFNHPTSQSHSVSSGISGPRQQLPSSAALHL